MARKPYTDGHNELRAGCSSPLNHHWEEYESKHNPQGGGWYMTLRCAKCGTVARQIINRDGTIETPRAYAYPEGYLNGGTSGWSRAQFRVKFLKGI